MGTAQGLDRVLCLGPQRHGGLAVRVGGSQVPCSEELALPLHRAYAFWLTQLLTYCSSLHSRSLDRTPSSRNTLLTKLRKPPPPTGLPQLGLALDCTEVFKNLLTQETTCLLPLDSFSYS